MGFLFGGKTDVSKMSDEEKVALLKTLQANLQEKGCWTAEWLSANGVPCLPVREEERLRLKNAEEKLSELNRMSEAKKEELDGLKGELDEMEKKHDALSLSVHEEEKKLADLRETANTFSAQNIEDLKKDVREGMNQVLENLSVKIDQENRELVRVLDKVEEKLMRKEADLQGFQEDSRLKATAPFLKQFIHLGDMMRKVVEENPVEPEASAAYLLAQIRQLTDSIDFILRDFSVDVFRHDESDTRFDPHTQQAFEYLTDDPTLDKKVRRTINPGYVWTLPYILKAKANGEEHPLKEYRMIFRREQVECFKYIKKEI